jgi:pyruvate/2-oxoglutarate dehydrogenase complex dihydrolipoamide acyltransferase (E2) component
MGDFTIRIPRVSVAISEASLVEFLVEDGQDVAEGEPLFLIATDKVDSEVQAGASGTVHWTGELDVVYPLGAEIGVIRER